MQELVRVFVSHHHSPDEDAFTAHLVLDLKRAGADVWVDDEGITSEDFVRRISDGLAGRQWLVLVMTPASLASPWVQREVNAALNEVTARRMLGVIPLVMIATAEQEIPTLWRPLHRYDATHGYGPARDGLFNAMGLSVVPRPSIPSSAAMSLPIAHTALASLTPSATRYPTPLVPAPLSKLGFRGVNVGGTPAIIPPLIAVPTGPFLMGSDLSHDSAARRDELPLHWVDVAAFQIAKYPVTVGEYTLAVGTGALPPPSEYALASLSQQQQHPDNPIIGVTWPEVIAYIAWLNTTTGEFGWRLPTEAEWEKAARWDQKRQASLIYPWGDAFDNRRCNVRQRWDDPILPVGSYRPGFARRSGASPLGVEEMTGNIWEWTSSAYKPYPFDPTAGNLDADDTDGIVLRGGDARAASRQKGTNLYDFGRSCGFRLAFTPGMGS